MDNQHDKNANGGKKDGVKSSKPAKPSPLKWRQSSLDEDMEKFFEIPRKDSLAKVFALAEPPKDRFHYNEHDYQMHRGESFPHMHQPLKALHSRSARRHRTSSRPSQSDFAEFGKSSSQANLPTAGQDETKSPTNEARPRRKVGFYLGDKAQESMESVDDDDASKERPSYKHHEHSNDLSLWSPTRPSHLIPSIPDTIASSDSDLSPAARNHAFSSVPDDDKENAASGLADSDHPDAHGEEEDVDGEPHGDKETKPRHRHKHHHRHHHHKHRDPDDISWRQRPGTDTELPEALCRGVPTEPEEAVMLQEGDLNLMASHRFEDPRGMRRHKIQAKNAVSSFIHIGRKEGGSGIQAIKTIPVTKKMYDHRPHEIFVELDELNKGDGEDMEWKETARWIKYEEDLEEGANRWGKPHVASLSFHSLLNLRKCLEQGTVLLDLEEKDLPGIAYRVVEAMVVNDQIKPDDKGAVMRALLVRHKHVCNHKQFQFAGLRRNFSSNISSASLTSMAEDKGKLSKTVSYANGTPEDKESAKTPLMHTSQEDGKVVEDGKSGGGGVAGTEDGTVTIDMKESSSSSPILSSVADDLWKYAADRSIMKKIPGGAEATTVLVGGVDFLDQPTIAFVRLAEGTILPTLLEVPIPVRFMFVLLGPIHDDLDYHEIGRSISTLMSNTKFHNVAYQADDRLDLMRAINEFLDDSIVLPPGDWESKSLLPIQAIQRKSQEIRLKKKAIKKLEAAADEKGFGDPLQRTGRPFGGLINEVKYRFPLYTSDIKDALNPQCLATVVFIYFAALSGAISFGGLLGDKTNNQIGVPETLVATSVAGIIFSFLSGQPLMIIGVTGPVLLFDESLFSFCESYDIEFLSIRVWIGIWVAVITLIFVASEGSFFLRYITRFTEEILAALISLIFIYESFMKLVEMYRMHPLQESYCDTGELLNYTTTHHAPTTGLSVMNRVMAAALSTASAFAPGNATTLSPTTAQDSAHSMMWTTSTESGVNQSRSALFPPLLSDDAADVSPVVNRPNTALLSTILMLGTFFAAFFLREFRNSKYLGRMARRAIGDFGVPIAMIIMVSLDYCIKDTYTQKLQVPEGLTPSLPEYRGWLISPMGLHRPMPVWLIFASILPAVLLFILLFMEIQICELIINKKERMLRKGTGFHIDFLLMSCLNIFCGLIGGPWMSAAIVRAISHIMSLTVMSQTHAPGEKPHILEVKEQRITNFLVSLIVGMSVGMAPLLRLISVAVLFGIFLYMGVVSMIGVQFFERLQLMFMPVKHHPDVVFVRRVRTMKMHAFTLIQLACLILLWIVKSTAAAISLPFILLMMIPLRRQLTLFFTTDELNSLDGIEMEMEDEDDEPDFYEEALLPG